MSSIVPTSFKSAFEGKRDILLSKLKVNDALLELLQDADVITDEQRKAIDDRMASKLMDELLRADDSKVDVFLKCLCKNSQSHVVEIILGERMVEWECQSIQVDVAQATPCVPATSNSTVCPQLVKELDANCSGVNGVTQMIDKIFVVCRHSNRIRVFGLNYEQLEDIKVKGLTAPQDIVACSETMSLYVADWGLSAECVWRVSTDGRPGHIDKFLVAPQLSSPKSLSVRSGRLLVTTLNDELLLYGADGVELKRLSFADRLGILHAVETSRETFVVCHREPQPQVVEVDGDGRVLRVYDDHQQPTFPYHLSIDSEGKVFIADHPQNRILLLTSDLQLGGVLLDTQHNQLVANPFRLFYVQQTQQLIVGSYLSPVVQVFAVG